MNECLGPSRKKHKGRVFISKFFRFEILGFEKVDEDCYKVYFRDVRLASLTRKRFAFGPVRSYDKWMFEVTRQSSLDLEDPVVTPLPAPLDLIIPFQAFGADFVLSLPGCSRVDIPPSKSDLENASAVFAEG